MNTYIVYKENGDKVTVGTNLIDIMNYLIETNLINKKTTIFVADEGKNGTDFTIQNYLKLFNDTTPWKQWLLENANDYLLYEELGFFVEKIK